MKSFTSAPHREQRIAEQDITFLHDGRSVVAHPPTAAQYTLFITAYQAVGGDITQVGDVVNFFFCLWGQEDFDYFKERLFDPDDPFDLGGAAGMVAILVDLLAVWVTPAVPREDASLSH
jgi:hypothetical protein